MYSAEHLTRLAEMNKTVGIHLLRLPQVWNKLVHYEKGLKNNLAVKGWFGKIILKSKAYRSKLFVNVCEIIAEESMDKGILQH